MMIRKITIVVFFFFDMNKEGNQWALTHEMLFSASDFVFLIFFFFFQINRSHHLPFSRTVPTFRGRGSSAVERATPGEEVPGSILAVATRSLLVGSVSV